MRIFRIIQTTDIKKKIAQWISEASGWLIQSVDNLYLNIVKYQPIKGSSYIKLPQEVRNSAKGLINMKNEDNGCNSSCSAAILCIFKCLDWLGQT